MGIFKALFGLPRARKASVVSQDSIYLHSSRWEELLVPRADGSIPLKLVGLDGQLWLAERTTRKLVNVGNRKLVGLGIWTAKLRGVSYHEAALRRVSTRVGDKVALVREPENEFDSNAIAVHAIPDTGVLGYVNKQMAARLSKQIDAGFAPEAICLATKPFKVLAATPAIVNYLRRG